MRPREEAFLQFEPTLFEQASNALSSGFTNVNFQDALAMMVSGTLTAALLNKAPITSTGLIIYGARALKDIFLRNSKEYISPENQKKLEGFFNSPAGKFFFTLSSAFFLSGSSVSLHNSLKDYVANSGNKELAALVNSASLLSLTSGAFTTAMIGNWAKIFNGLYKDYAGKDERLILEAFEKLANHPMMVNMVASLGYFVGVGASEAIDPDYKTDPLIAAGASGLAFIGFSFMEKYREENKGKSLASEIRDNEDHCFPKPNAGERMISKIAFENGRFVAAEGFRDDNISQKFAENLNLACNIILVTNPAKAEFLRKIPKDINKDNDPESLEPTIKNLVLAITETLKPLEKAIYQASAPTHDPAVTVATPAVTHTRSPDIV